MAYIDTSLLVAYYCPEKLSHKAESSLLSVSRPSISSLVELELTCAVARKVRERELSTTDGSRIIAEFRSHVSAGAFTVHEISASDYSRASSWIGSFTCALRALDAIHLAVAAELLEEVLTADTQMATAARHLKIPCRLIS